MLCRIANFEFRYEMVRRQFEVLADVGYLENNPALLPKKSDLEIHRSKRPSEAQVAARYRQFDNMLAAHGIPSRDLLHIEMEKLPERDEHKWNDLISTVEQSDKLAQAWSEAIARARRETENFWPELWETEERALAVLRKMRELLRGFWCEEDERRREWYIYKACEYYRSFMVQRELREQLRTADEGPTKQAALAGIAAYLEERDRRLDQPTELSMFEKALLELQDRATKASLAPCKCQNKRCKSGRTYFLRSKKQRKYCSNACSDEGERRRKRNWWNDPDNKDKRRPK
jgi:hypothetical protein